MKPPPIFTYFQTARGKQRWRWRLTAGNGEITCQSEGYATRSSAVRSSRRLASIAIEAEVARLKNRPAAAPRRR